MRVLHAQARNLDVLEKNVWIPGSLAMLAPRNDEQNKSPGSLRGFYFVRISPKLRCSRTVR